MSEPVAVGVRSEGELLMISSMQGMYYDYYDSVNWRTGHLTCCKLDLTA